MFANFRGYSVRAINDAFAVGHFVFAIDEDRTLAAQFFDHKAVVDNLLAHIDRWSEGF
jgi:hypothetical protein